MSEAGGGICGTLPLVKLPAQEPGQYGGRPDEEDPAAADDTSGGGSDRPAHPVDQRLLDEIFGDVLPDTTSDERGLANSHGDDWYLENRPPHHER